ncbi:uncharacterized protein TrAFT101_008835 [Trichoderma asperellum]|uniref:uncharacterized protein n=1 Tax=Trichoderma asperellum TaxID=101201 RepID=UPI003321A919|nr:hypothetical protein TrAFT101_008835 [Trichoderma asperellum]
MQLARTCRQMNQDQSLYRSLPLIDNWSLFGHPLVQEPAWSMPVDSPSHLPPAVSSREQSPENPSRSTRGRDIYREI